MTSGESIKVGVVGGGRMGAGIAHAFAGAGCDVTVVEISEQTQEAARLQIKSNAERAASKSPEAPPAAEVMDRVHFVGAVADLPRDARLVVEAVPEVPEIKAQVFQAAEAVVGSDCVLATNTSSLSIGSLAESLKDPSRFLGMHFFNPVPASTLIEIVTGPETSAATTAFAVEWTRKLGKTEIVVRDSPGFATSRLGVLLGLEGIRMLEEGVADADAIDKAMELGYRHPMGPLRLTDLVGLDVRLHIAEYLEATLGPRFAPPALLREKVQRGELGRKTGQGFYSWES